MKTIRIVLNANPNEEDGLRIYSAKDGSDITEHLGGIIKLTVVAEERELTSAQVELYAEVEAEVDPEHIDLACSDPLQ